MKYPFTSMINYNIRKHTNGTGYKEIQMKNKKKREKTGVG